MIYVQVCWTITTIEATLHTLVVISLKDNFPQ